MLNLGRMPEVLRLIDLALAEDLGRGDVTTESVIDKETVASGAVVAREQLVVSGVDVARTVFTRVDRHIRAVVRQPNGSKVEAGAVILDIDGPADAVLAAERTALNFLQRLSGVATMSRRFADAVAGSKTRVVDTRKTTPGWRVLEKAAVRDGGCFNHRADLGSGILIKDNHVIACGGVGAAVERARARAPHPLRIEVEVDSLAQLDEAIAARADLVLCDNMSVDEVRQAAERAHAAGIQVEVSGGMILQRVPLYAEAGADFISVGALTHSARAVDIALDFL
ncbi:MAG TPA: carboxylating nicotinate-nucleotide diphosphorylase [Kofleriaceae bacterium]|nr:carboxylating nicotinate-nucleotide diphosphorylase [Kofleriaceae bacterium]